MQPAKIRNPKDPWRRLGGKKALAVVEEMLAIGNAPEPPPKRCANVRAIKLPRMSLDLMLRAAGFSRLADRPVVRDEAGDCWG